MTGCLGGWMDENRLISKQLEAPRPRLPGINDTSFQYRWVKVHVQAPSFSLGFYKTGNFPYG